MNKSEDLAKLQSICENCTKCDLAKTRNKVVFADGSANAPILWIGEAPGADEDASGLPFVGRAGKLLNTFFEQAGISREKDVYICNTVKCRPPENRVPTPTEKQACMDYLLKQIEIINPKVIALCGATAMSTFLGNKEKISAIRGKWIKILDNRDAMAVFHPSYLLRNHSTEENSPRWLMIKDLETIRQRALSK